MAGTRSAYQGCLLGLAVGDAMGFPVDDMKWRAIREDYGPNGLMGFDIANDSADVTSHTSFVPLPPTACCWAAPRNGSRAGWLPMSATSP